jgi:hypothetical protein
MSLPDDREKTDANSPPAAESSERRSEPRTASNASAFVRLLNPLQTSERLPARVADLSRGGMKLILDRPLMPGTLVQIRFEGKLLLGEVRFCNPVDAEFQIGIRLQDIFDTNA